MAEMDLAEEEMMDRSAAEQPRSRLETAGETCDVDFICHGGP